VPITELRIEGLRTLEKIRLELDGLTVLIGDNGAGKSSILEACEILRRATSRSFMDELYGIHGGLTALLRQGAPRLTIGLTIQLAKNDFSPQDAGHECVKNIGYSGTFEYELSIVPNGSFAALEEIVRYSPRQKTSLHGAKKGKNLGAKSNLSSTRTAAVICVQRSATSISFPNWQKSIPHRDDDIEAQVPFVATLGSDWGDPRYMEAQCVAAYLRNLRVHIPFETMPAWAARALDRKSALRAPALLTPATHLEKLGVNLASAYHALKNSFGRSYWDDTLAYIRLGLGERIEDVVTWADPSGGNIGLSIKLIGLDVPISAAQLSDGMLSYLAFVAMFRLHVTKPSLLAFDEPDLHLHPHLLMRVLDFFESMAKDTPVLLATHSDRLLDGLTDPAKSVVLCSLDERGATRLVRPDREALAKWLERYRGLGDIRSAGHAASVMTKVEPQ
jgi:predicted ATPase